MGTEFINQAPVKRVEIYKWQRQLYAGEGEISLKRGSYAGGMAFLLIGSRNDGFYAFAYFNEKQLRILALEIEELLGGTGGGAPREGWEDTVVSSDEVRDA